MTGYRIALFIHVLAAIVWVGGGIVLQILVHRIKNGDSPQLMGPLGKEISFIGERVFGPASVVVLIAGIYMVLEADIGFEEPWVALGLGGLILAAGIGMGYLGPQSKKMDELAAAHGPASPEVKAQADRLQTAARITLAILVTVVFVMTYKPF